MCFTSPPYNMGNKGDHWQGIKNIAMNGGNAYRNDIDCKSDAEYGAMLAASLGNALSHADDAMFNVGILSGSKAGVVSMLEAHKDRFFEIVAWCKATAMPLGMRSQKGMVSHRFEPVFCFNQDGLRRFSHPQWEVGHGSNVVESDKNNVNEFAAVHNAAFPVEFAAEVVRNFTEASVLDLFGGTGTTMMAAEQLGRTCYTMDIDPRYVDVMLRRWEDHTGGKAVLVDSEQAPVADGTGDFGT